MSMGLVREWVAEVLVLGLLGGIWLVGHRTGWKLPARTELAGGVALDAHGHAKDGIHDWCDEHGVPESRCIQCNPELAGADPGDWCAEHGVPESRCALCNPELVPAFGEEVPGRPGCISHLRKVQLASPEARARVGIGLAPVTTSTVREILEAPAELEYEASRVAHVASRSEGTVRRALVGLGTRVGAGQALAVIESPAAGRARSELLRALAEVELKGRTLARMRATASDGFRTAAELDEAEAAARAAAVAVQAAEVELAGLGIPVRAAELAGLAPEEARTRLNRAGLPEAVARDLGGDPGLAGLVVVRAPFAGEIVEHHAVAGEPVDPAKELFTLADLSLMWVILELPAADADRITTGLEVEFAPDRGGEGARGELTWISSALDPKTRTLKARAEVLNEERRLRAHSFGVGRVLLRETDGAPVVPVEAVQWEGCCRVVFVHERDDLYAVRKVRTGVEADGTVEILDGLEPGTVVAAQGARVLTAQLLKAQLGAGCTDH